MRHTATVSLEPEQPTSTQPNQVFLFDAELTEEGVSEEAAYTLINYSRSPFDLMEGQTKIFIFSALINVPSGVETYTDSHAYFVERYSSGDVVREINEAAHDHFFGVAPLLIDNRVVGVLCQSLKNANGPSVWKIRMEVQQI
jgi:hypothetical protein